jgi:hypothetical protein
MPAAAFGQQRKYPIIVQLGWIMACTLPLRSLERNQDKIDSGVASVAKFVPGA